MQTHYLLAIDQGTTSTRAVIFDKLGHPISQSQLELRNHFPKPGWVEHDPEEIWESCLSCCRKVLEKANLSVNDLTAIGIANQRETTIVWDRETGKPIYPAIVWQDRRTADQCQKLRDQGLEAMIQAKTGLLLDPYFSASKIAWILAHVTDAREKADRGQLAFGTVNSFLLWRLTEGQTFATDATNASRTLLFNIHEQCWDAELLSLFNIPLSMLAEVHDNCADFGKVNGQLFAHGEANQIPIAAMAGDQQAALVGQACFDDGMVKCTYGTGSFLLFNTGTQAMTSKQRLLTTVAYRLNGVTHYATEGSIFSAGTTIQWFRDKLKLIQRAADTEAIAQSTRSNGGVYLVPGFTGLGAPHWEPHARAAIFGLTRDSSAAHIVRAGLEAVGYQTRDLLESMHHDGARLPAELRVDGGMTNNNWLMQFLADILNIPVAKPEMTEITALGVAYLAGLQVGIYQSVADLALTWKAARKFNPKLKSSERENYYQQWQQAVAACCRYAP